MTDQVPGEGGVPQVTVKLPDGSTREYPAGVLPSEVAASIGRRLAESAVVARVDGAVVDLNRPLTNDCEFAVVTPDSDDGLFVIRHSTAHVLAQAVLNLFPGAKYAIGPPIADGFYYDFELPPGPDGTPAHFTEDDLARLEARMREIVAEAQPFSREEHGREAGLAMFADQPYKLEIIEAGEAAQGVLENGYVSVYRNPRNRPPDAPPDGYGEFYDLCRGPHVPHTKRLPHFKLMKVAGAYWRGDEKRPMLQRIYGTAWPSKKELDEHLHRLEEAERRDHRKLGVELDLISFPEEIGGGLAVWHPKGAMIRKQMEDFSRAEHEAAGYEFVVTPHLTKSNLFETSGHLDFYADGMYPPMEMEGAKYYPKPMNCPMHCLIFRSRTRSYRELPLRLFEFGTVYRYERSGVLHGLLRTRGFTQDDSHIYCTMDQIVPELTSLLGFVLRILRTFGFEHFEAELSTRPEGKSVGSDEDWEKATEALHQALRNAGLPYTVAEGEGAFYGPKIDVHLKDAIGRRWQLSTLQCDFNHPIRFDLTYIGEDNERHRPIMIHRALFGSVERFFGILVEHYAGAFPTWLAPTQVLVLPVADRHEDYTAAVVARLRSEGFRVDSTDATHDTLGARVRRGKLDKIPYLLVVGDADVEAGTVGVNVRGTDRPERDVPLDDFVARLAAEVAARA
ncbi:MAG TPA: threonine--tRNA ligase [Acidimicrobiia bacterium]|nr:threonine--tRNA ligase [Acidimicrobiia bacterium]